MGVNKVNLSNGETIIDLTSDSVSPETLAEGETAHNSQGERIMGTMSRGGDMFKSIYDTDNNGKVDNADNSDKLGGQLPSYYAKAEHSHTTIDLIEALPVGKLEIVNDSVVISPIGLVLGDLDGYPIEVLAKQENTKNYIAIPIASSVTVELGPYGNLQVFLKFCLDDGTTQYIPITVPIPTYVHQLRGYTLYISPFDEYEQDFFGLLAGTVPIDITPTANSTNMLTSGAIHTALQDIKTKDLLEYAKKSEIPIIPTKVSAFENDKGYLTEHQSLEEYAKRDELPVVPTNVSAFTNDKGYLTEETDPTVPKWAKEPNRPTYTAADVGADAKDTASNLVSAHNTGTGTHSDIRLLIKNLTDRLDAVANSTDDELDQLSEIVAYIKSNKSLIDSITTSKVNVADIVNNLTTNVSNKPLSAAQGVVLKALIDAITVPTKVSQLENDTGYAKKTDIPSAYSHPSTHPASMITGLATVATSGKYSDLSGRPTIPTVPTSLPANGGNADTVDGYHIRTGTSGADGYITFVV